MPYRLKAPDRYARAMLLFTKGYHESLSKTVNDAIFHVQSSGLALVKDIELFSMCEHHIVPFTGKVRGHILVLPVPFMSNPMPHSMRTSDLILRI